MNGAPKTGQRYSPVARLTFPDDGLTITLLHERNQPLLRTMPFVDGDRVLIDAPLPDTTRGRDVATDMRQERPLCTVGCPLNLHRVLRAGAGTYGR